MSDWCERTSERTSEWPSTFVRILGWSAPLCGVVEARCRLPMRARASLSGAQPASFRPGCNPRQEGPPRAVGGAVGGVVGGLVDGVVGGMVDGVVEVGGVVDSASSCVVDDVVGCAIDSVDGDGVMIREGAVGCVVNGVGGRVVGGKAGAEVGLAEMHTLIHLSGMEQRCWLSSVSVVNAISSASGRRGKVEGENRIR